VRHIKVIPFRKLSYLTQPVEMEKYLEKKLTSTSSEGDVGADADMVNAAGSSGTTTIQGGGEVDGPPVTEEVKVFATEEQIQLVFSNSLVSIQF